MASEVILHAESISKRFGGIQALDQVSTSLRRGTVTALIGENGAGKSTLVKILAGYHSPDAGTIELDGVPVALDSVESAMARGISVIHQTPAFAPDLSVVDNVFLGQEATPRPGRRGMSRFDRRAETQVLAPFLAEYEADIDPNGRMRRLRAYEQRLVGIIKALVHSARILIMDEPTAALPAKERDLLLSRILQLKTSGYSILYVSHLLEEIEEVADEIIALRDGRVSGYEAPVPSVHRMIEMMTGADVGSIAEVYSGNGLKGDVRHNARDDLETGDADHAFELTPPITVSAGTAVKEPVELHFRQGSITLLTGIVGSGIADLARAMYGSSEHLLAEYSRSGRQYRLRSAKDAIRAGIGYLSDDRRNEGVLPHFSVRKNLTLPALDLVSAGVGHVYDRREKPAVTSLIDRLSVKCSSPEQQILELSGGNQQKVMLARWLFARSALLVLNEPTQGIDVKAKRDVVTLLKEFTGAGGTCVIVTTDPEEFLKVADVCVVVRKGRIVRTLRGSSLSKGEIAHAMLTEDTQEGQRE
mgnify:CR=1 FL=1